MTDEIEKLLKLAGPREEVPDDVEQRTYELVRREWRAASQQPDGSSIYKRVRRAWKRDARMDTFFRWFLPLGGVAAAALAILVLMQPSPVAINPIGTVSKAVQPAAASSRFSSGMAIFVGDSIITGDGEGLSLLLARRESVRIDENTELHIDARDRFTLVKGRVYADTGQFMYRDGGLEIETEFGVVTDVGTQFSVSSRDQRFEVAVREGRVDMRNDSSTLVVLVGQQLSMRQNMEPEFSSVDAHDDSWNWAAELAPDFEGKNRSLFSFLKWAARETGRELIFESDELRMLAMRADIRGQVSSLTPDEALLAMQPITTVRYRIEADKIVIEQ
jgi:FecR protein